MNTIPHSQEDLTAFDPTGKYALFLPSISSIYVRMLSKPIENVRDGKMLKNIPDPQQLNFLNKDKSLFYYPYALYSLGHAVLDTERSDIRESMIQKRDRKNTLVIGDSGGFQIAKGVIEWPWEKKGEQDDMRMTILKWLEHTSDWSMTLDFPYKSLVNERAVKAGMDTREKCLNGTVENLEFFMKHRTPGATKFLNVCQGETFDEAEIWYNAVKGFNSTKKWKEKAFEGWSFGGVSAFDFELILRRIIRMRDEKLIENTGWLHFLGSGKIHGAPAFTQLQTHLRKINPELRVSYDAASPFISAAHGKIYSNYVIDARRVAIPMECVIDNKNMTVDEQNLPFFLCNSPVGQRLTLGDICVNLDNKYNSAWDGYTYVLLMAHSAYLHIKAIQTVNLLYDVPNRSRPDKYDEETRKVLKEGSDVKRLHLPTEVFEMRDIMEEVFTSQKPMDVIDHHKKFLQGYLGVVSERRGGTHIDKNPLFKKKLDHLEKLEVEDIMGEAVDVLDDENFANMIKNDLGEE